MPKTVTRTDETAAPADETAPVEAPTEGAATEGGKEKQHRTPPQYLAIEVDAFPEQEEFTRTGAVGRESVYINLMTDIAKNKPGKIVLLTHFVTATSAQDVVNAFCGYTDSKKVYHEPTRVVPVGELSDWVFKAIKVKNPETKDDPIKQGRPYHSELYVQYVGPAIS